MIGDWLTVLPSWLLVGLAIGLLATLVVAGTFLVGSRLFGSDGSDGRRNDGGSVEGSARRRSEIREYLRGLEEVFVEDYRVHGRTVAFYLPRRDVAITFDARAYFSLEDADTYAVLCEHEMPTHLLGRRLPFDTPETAIPPGTNADPVAAAFAELGIDRTTDERAVRTAYRERVKSVHPDQGGTEEGFRRVREAYAIARGYTQQTAS
ncbi:MAG: DnaJ domain-containing protein [Haloferacaceae archaeon]